MLELSEVLEVIDNFKIALSRQAIGYENKGAEGLSLKMRFGIDVLETLSNDLKAKLGGGPVCQADGAV